ncbi:hypothetical protein QCA50_008816 [Cerrena zonata]|uniref:Uncharacterized protein n=1 Tax=Cerrena zonata TaxID=2478898 RepID=A0AAW0G7S8_9APHY
MIGFALHRNICISRISSDFGWMSTYVVFHNECTSTSASASTSAPVCRITPPRIPVSSTQRQRLAAVASFRKAFEDPAVGHRFHLQGSTCEILPYPYPRLTNSEQYVFNDTCPTLSGIQPRPARINHRVLHSTLFESLCDISRDR